MPKSRSWPCDRPAEGLLGPIWPWSPRWRNRFLPFLPMVCMGFGEGFGSVMGWFGSGLECVGRLDRQNRGPGRVTSLWKAFWRPIWRPPPRSGGVGPRRRRQAESVNRGAPLRGWPGLYNKTSFQVLRKHLVPERC